MDRLEVDQLQLLLSLFIGLMVLFVAGLTIYVVVATLRRDAEVAAAFQDVEDLVVRPSLLVVGQILALVRDEPGGPLLVEVDGTKYGSLSEVDDATIKRQIMDAALEMIQFTGVLGAAAPELPPLEETDHWREDLKEESQAELERALTPEAEDEPQIPPVPPAPEEVEERFLDLLSELGQTPEPIEKPSLVASLQQRVRPQGASAKGPRSLVDEIEDIVQRKVRLEPALVGRGVHVNRGPGGSVIFAFEGQEYEKVEDIPNLTARFVIRESIQEWDELT